VNVRLRCAICHGAVGREEAVHCASCLALHHADCHSEHGRCAAHGCGERRTVVAGPSSSRALATALPAAKGGRRGPCRAVLGGLVALGAIAGASGLLAQDGRWRDATPRPPRGCGHLEPGPRIAADVREPPARAARDLALVARDFRLPVSLGEGERVRLTVRESGYTHVVIERGHGRVETVLTAEPGDRVVLQVGDERLVAAPGQSIVFE
jgi:hypothetical protein